MIGLIKQVMFVNLFSLAMPMWFMHGGGDSYTNAISAVMYLIIPIIVQIICFKKIDLKMENSSGVKQIEIAVALWIAAWWEWIFQLNDNLILWSRDLGKCFELSFSFSYWLVVGAYNMIMLTITVLISYHLSVFIQKVLPGKNA